MSEPKHESRGSQRQSRRRRLRRKSKVKFLEDAHQQWGLAAGFAADGRTMLTLRDLVSRQAPTPSIDTLTEEQRRELTVERLRHFPDYKLCVLGLRQPVTQRRAIREVRQGTRLGQFLVRAEQNAIRLILDRARKSKRRS